MLRRLRKANTDRRSQASGGATPRSGYRCPVKIGLCGTNVDRDSDPLEIAALAQFAPDFGAQISAILRPWQPVKLVLEIRQETGVYLHLD